MAKILSFKNPVLYWTIDIEPDTEDRVKVRKMDDDHILIFISTESFDRIDELRRQAEALIYSPVCRFKA